MGRHLSLVLLSSISFSPSHLGSKLRTHRFHFDMETSVTSTDKKHHQKNKIVTTMSFSVICNFEAPSDEHLRMHIRKEHDDRVLSCEKCEVTCRGRAKFKVHMRTHMTVTCKHCGKKILYNGRTSHMKQCIGENP